MRRMGRYGGWKICTGILPEDQVAWNAQCGGVSPKKAGSTLSLHRLMFMLIFMTSMASVRHIDHIPPVQNSLEAVSYIPQPPYHHSRKDP